MTIHSKNKSKLTWIYKLPSIQVLLMFPAPLPEIHPTGDTSAAGDAPITELDDSEILSLSSLGLLVLRNLFTEDDDDLNLEESPEPPR